MAESAVFLSFFEAWSRNSQDHEPERVGNQNFPIKDKVFKPNNLLVPRRMEPP